MSDSVDLIVMGVEGEIPRAEMSSRLVQKFKQEAYTFEALLDGAYGESAPYAAQTDVAPSQAEGGKEQLESVGLICTVVPTGETPEPLYVAPIAQQSAEVGESGVGELGEQASDHAALATYKSGGDGEVEETAEAKAVTFDTDNEFEDAENALASFKKDTGKSSVSDNTAVDFSDDIESVGADTELVGLAAAKQSRISVAELDDSLNHDFSDDLQEVGAEELSAGLKEAQQVKPDFNAAVTEVDFSDEVASIGIREEDPLMPEVSKSKLEEEVAEHNLDSFPKEDTADSVDFSDELELLAAQEVPVKTESAGPINKADVPEALADGAVDELKADLIDPAPAEKEVKEKVELDDGGLSLSTNNDEPLTTRKAKSSADSADDGGLSLSEDASVVTQADSGAAGDESTHNDAPAEVATSGETVELDTTNNSEQRSSTEAEPTVAGNESTPAAVATVTTTAVEPLVPQQSTSAQKNPAPGQSPPVAMPAATVKANADPTTTPIAAPAAVAVPEPVAVPAPAVAASPSVAQEHNTPPTGNVVQANSGAAPSGGLVLPGQMSRSVAPEIVSEDDLDDASTTATEPLRQVMPETATDIGNAAHYNPAEDVVRDAIEKAQAGKIGKKKIAVAIAGVAVLAAAGTFAFMNTGSVTPGRDAGNGDSSVLTEVKDASGAIEKMRVEVAELRPDADLENLSTGELLVNLSVNQTNGIADLESYFLESSDQVRKGPRIGAAVAAESEWMVRNRQPHPADKYFDEWSNREADLSLFLALLDNLIEKGDLEVAQQLRDRAKDKLFAVMSTQRLARAYNDVGQHAEVTQLMAMASRDTYAIKAPEERVLALSDYAFTEQAIGLNEDAMDTFLKTSILARSLVKPERRAVGLSSAALYFDRSGRSKQAKDLLEQSMQAGNEIPENTAARDLAIRYIALLEARMGLFNQALEHTGLIVDPFATVSAYHGIALAIESSGDNTNARKVLNMAYRAGSLIEDKEERSRMLSKVVLTSESE